MTTERMVLGTTWDHPGSSGGDDGRPPRRLRRGWADAAERAGWRWAALVWAVALLALILQNPGHMTFDTKLGVDIDPVGFYQTLWNLWDPLEWLGAIQDQYIGYAFPMGAFYLVAHVVHVPVWLTERLWMSLLIAAAFWGPVKLAEALGIGSRPTRLLAGAAFALWPTFTILVGSSSGGVLPGVLAPLAVLPLARASTARQAAFGSAVVVLFMGGINAADTLAAVVPAGLYILTRPGRRRWALTAWWVPAVLLAISWWLVPLLYQGKYGFNFLPYIEQAGTTTATMSAATALRGAGNWVAYLNLGAQPWLTAGSVAVASAFAVAAATVASAAGLAGLARRDLPEAAWLRLTLAAAAVWVLVGYGGTLGGPLHQQVQAALNGPVAALRNVFKIEPALALVLVLGIAHVLHRAAWPRAATRGLAVLAALVALAGLSLPFLDGKALQPGAFTRVPQYWTRAAAWLGTHNSTDTTLVVPADSHGIYTWGQSIDEPLEPLAKSPWVQRNLVPFSGGGTYDLLNGAEQAIESGTASPGLAGYLDRAGIRYVLVRNDLSPAQVGYTPPTVVHAALKQSGFVRVAAFGAPVPGGPAGQGTALQVEAIEPNYPAVEIYQAASAASRPQGPATVLPAASTTLVDGGPASLLQLEGQGLLTRQPAVIAGQDARADPVAGQQDVTDGLRRADTLFGLPNNNTSYTYTASGTIPPGDPQGAGGQAPRQLLPAGTAGHQTVAVIGGAASVTASSAGTWLTELPQGDPVNAFDGNPSTAWIEASPGSAAGQWAQINFTRPQQLSGPLTVRLLDDGLPRPVATRLVVSTAAGHVTDGTRVTGAAQPLNVPPGTTSFLRVTIAAARGGIPGGPGAGISEVTIPGVTATRFLKPAQDQSGPADLAFSFHRDTATTLGLPGAPPEPALDRIFTTPAPRSYALSASVTAVPGAALNALLDQVGSGTPAQLRITASSTFDSLPVLRPQNLLASGSVAGWVAAGRNATLHLQWTGRPRAVGQLDLTASTLGIAAQPTQVLITSPAGNRDVPVPSSGVLNFSPLLTNQLTISFPGVVPTTSVNPIVGQAQQLPVGLASLSIPALSSLSTGIPAANAPFALRCGQGPPVTVDGRAYATAVSGTVRDLTGLTPLPLTLCTKGAALTLGAGRHTLTSPGSGVPLTVTDLSLRPAPAAAPAKTAPAKAAPAKTAPAKAAPATAGTAPATTSAATAGRQLRIGSWGAESRTVTIGAGPQSYLEVHQAASPGWTATLDGRPLAPVTLDGWQQAYVVPAGAGGKVIMTFAAATQYRLLLGISAIGVLLLILIALLPARRRSRRRDAADPGGPAPAGPVLSPAGPVLSPVGFALALVVAAAALALVGGPLVAAVPVLALLAWWQPRLLPWLAFAAFCVAGALAIPDLHQPPQAGTGAFSGAAQAAALIALAAALTPAVRRRQRRGGDAVAARDGRVE